MTLAYPLDFQASEPQIEKLSLKNTPKSDYKSRIELELEKQEGNLRTVQLALEVLTGACATLPDPESSKLDEEDDEGEGIDEEEGKSGGNFGEDSRFNFSSRYDGWYRRRGYGC